MLLRSRLLVPAVLVAVLGFAMVVGGGVVGSGFVIGGVGRSGPAGTDITAQGDRPPRTPAAAASSPGLAVSLGAGAGADGHDRDGADSPGGRGGGGDGRGATAGSGASAGAGGRSAPDGGGSAGSNGTRTGAGTTAACTTSAASRAAATRVAALSLEQQAGQVVMVGVPISSPRTAIGLVRQSRLGGVFLQGRSAQSASGLHDEVRAVQEAARGDVGTPVHIAVDQEGGQVQSLSGLGFERIPTALEQGGWDAATLRQRTSGWSRALAEAGVTLDLAPVADTVAPGTAQDNPPIGFYQRNFGTDPGSVAADMRVAVPAMQQAGLLATVKHFPGLGRVHANTDTSAAAVDETASTTDPDLEPFRAAISAGTAAVMVSLARYPQLDPDAPAVFSHPVVTGLLRGQLGFGGLVVSDDLGAAVAVASVPVGERAVRFIEAGGDLALSVRGADGATMTAALAAEARRSPTFARRLTQAATSVLASKARAGLLGCTP
ncbi:beta-N-acetylhexosaminidase [Frankia sp. AiPs1]|uniref:glycoside hydrolase family 3 N-terminal domain-containing protein n=1 Tax=Frankia sp. AiPa1 TaxID=573492 RepID=UPI00202B0743|nr:glycoside hydrolase family 3 N-terminal domain-containing protein [Frankia sp. AiPa1]MCL9761197.1 hypothetical protein [Frankia sp. AiPa1]